MELGLSMMRSDRLCPPRREGAPAILGSRLEILDGVGHLPQPEAPGRFITVLERFHRREPAGTV